MMDTSSQSVNLKISLILFLLGVWAVPASPATAQDETLTGWFNMTIADYPPESDRGSEITYGLTDDHGQYYELLIDIELMQPLGGPVALNRKRVTVMGEWEEVGPDAIEKFRVYSIELAPSPSTASPGETFASDLSPDEVPPPRSALPAIRRDTHLRGPQPWVTILCRFAETQFTPHFVSHYERMMGSSEPGSLGHYWREVSYGNIDLTGSVVVGWYDLPRPYSYYVYDRDGDGKGDHNTSRTAEDCTTAADAEVFFPDFYGINLVFNDVIDGPSRGGSRRLTRDGRTKNYGVTWLTWPGSEYQNVWAHEMGHAFGLRHSSGPYGQDDPPSSSTTYDSYWDVMSGGEFFFHLYPEYGYLGVHTIAYHKDFLGWIPPDRKYVAPPNSRRTITLDRLAQPNSEGYLMAQIPIGYSTFYTVEVRLFAGYDDGIPNEAIVIHKVDTRRGDRLAQVVDIDNNFNPNDEGAMWTLGEIFTDSENGIQVSIDATYSTGFQVTINTNPATFTTCSESILPTQRLFVGHGGNARINVVAPGGCSWEATSNNPWIRITDGSSGRGSGDVSYTVAANPNLNARTGTLTIAGQAFTVLQTGVNGNLFEDDLENGVNGWSSEHTPWALTTASSRSGAYALTDSPGGNYRNDQSPWSSAIWSPVIDLTEVTSATLTFWHRHDFAGGDSGRVLVAYTRSLIGGVLRTFTGPQTAWQQVSLDLSPYTGSRIRLSFQLMSDTSENADGWYIDDVAVSSSDFVAPEETQAVLENPSSASFQSGIGMISGWACNAQAIVIELNGRPLQAAYGTVREDTLGVCGDTNNGFSLLWNWNNLGAGPHTVRALIDGVEFANTTVRVTTLGEDPFPRGLSGTFNLPDFPTSGETTVVQWEEALQNFIITDGSPARGEGYNRVAGVNATLENPSLGSAQSGVGVISGWACEAGEIVIELDGKPLKAGYGTTREDTRSVCGDANNGFSLLWNWNNLGAGTHTVRALIDGQEFANTTVRVTTFGKEFLRGVSGTFPIPDFPSPRETKKLQWEEALQNFVIIP